MLSNLDNQNPKVYSGNIKIILGLTGSVATIIAPKIIAAIKKAMPYEHSIEVVMTDKAQKFFDASELSKQGAVKVYTEDNEWQWETPDRTCYPRDSLVQGTIARNRWEKDFPILHIELSKNAACLVIAPASMNTIAKMAHGIADNLLTSVYAAWDKTRPVIVAPAMNTNMLVSNANGRNMFQLQNDDGCHFVGPVEKKLACGDYGDGALADAKDIASAVVFNLRWAFPILDSCPGIPVGKHLGSFGAFRSHGKRHCGVDLYCQNGSPVYAVEAGRVVNVDTFTGEPVGSPWWNTTMAVKVEGASGVVCYGEISPCSRIRVGDVVEKSDLIGHVTQVLRSDIPRADIPGHSPSMLHLQLYKHGMIHKDESWMDDKECPDGVLDPTKHLQLASGKPVAELDMR